MKPHHDDTSSNNTSSIVEDDELRLIDELVRLAFATGASAGVGSGRRVEVSRITDANRGGGIFSRVFRLELTATAGNEVEDRHPVPPSVVAKLPARGVNRLAAAQSGAYRREAHCYRELLLDAGLPAIEAYAVIEHDDGAASLLLPDLTSLRWPDQLSGLKPQDARAVVDALARFHHRWRHDLDRPERRHAALLEVRANTVAGFDHGSLTTGLRTVERRWAKHLSRRQLAALTMVVRNHDDVAAAFGSHHPVTLCHGDPRAANLAFSPDGSAVLVDWQQVARQFGESDVAWLCATSLAPDDRRAFEHDLVREYGGDVERYRLGLALPAMAVLLLAQRKVDSARIATIVATSLDRIASAVVDNW